MELRQLQCLVTCARTQSFSKAAAMLYTSQSNVSKTIAALEKELGTKLFERRQHGIRLTEKGKDICQIAMQMLEGREKIMESAGEGELDVLRISFQPNPWFASAFCEYYVRFGAEGRRCNVTSAPVDEIIRRLYSHLDQLGFAYIEDSQMARLEESFRANHLGCLPLGKTRSLLFYGREAKKADLKELSLIQGQEDHYSGISLWKERLTQTGPELKPKVMITTNSDLVLQEILQRTSLCNISPAYQSHKEHAFFPDAGQIEETGLGVQFICLFRNDQALEEGPKHFLSFIRKYMEEQ